MPHIRRFRLLAPVFVVALGVPPMPQRGFSQTLPPIDPTEKPQRREALLRANPDKPVRKPNWLLPLVGATEDEVEAFYRTSSWITPLQQVRFLYGFGQGTKSLSADMATLLFRNGIQTTFGSSVTASNPDSQSGQGKDATDSPSQAIERLKAGGDFFVRAAYPLLAAGGADKPALLSVFSISKLGFNISGLGSEATITEATERNFNSSLEVYGQYSAIKPKNHEFAEGFVYGDIRSGWQNVQPQFAKAVGLPHKNFMLTQVSAGVQFGQFIRIGFQRYYGPSQAFNIPKNDLDKWHLVLQIIPPTSK